MKRIAFFTLFISLAQFALAQVTPTAAPTSLSAQWPTITTNNKPWTRWWWQGSAVNKEGIAYSLAALASAGIGGVEVAAVNAVKGQEDKNISYLSPKWVNAFEATLQEAKKLNVNVGLANAGVGSFGGSWIIKEDAAKTLHINTYTVKNGNTLAENITFIPDGYYHTESKKGYVNSGSNLPTGNELQALSFDVLRSPKILPLMLLIGISEKGNTIDLTTKVSKEGKLLWTAPEGADWTLYALFQGWQGNWVNQAAPGNEGTVIDPYATSALQHYLQRFDAAFKDKDVTTLHHFTNNGYQIKDAKQQADFTATFFKEFKQRRGYSFIDVLPIWTQKNEKAGYSRILYDYRLTIEELAIENFAKPLQSWTTIKGKKLRSNAYGMPANILDANAFSTIPVTASTDILKNKFTSSAASTLGKNLIAGEVGKDLDEQFLATPAAIKQAVDKNFIAGINQIFWYGSAYNPQQEQWPGWLFSSGIHFTPNNTYWPYFIKLNDYVTRCQSFLQKGQPANDLLVYYPAHDVLSKPTNSVLLPLDGLEALDSTPCRAAATQLIEKGYAFDFISDKQISTVKNANKQLQLLANNYQAILIPAAQYMPAATLAHLMQLTRNGATILFYNHLPTTLPGYFNQEKKQVAFTRMLDSLLFHPISNTIQQASFGKGNVLLSNDLQALLNQAAITHEAFAAEGLVFIKRKYTYGDYYFVLNPTNTPYDGWLPLTTTVSNALLFNPMSTVNGVALTRKNAKGNIEVYVQLKPNETCILQTSRIPVTGNLYPYTNALTPPVEVGGQWKLTFGDGAAGLPSPKTFYNLQLWTSIDDNEAKIFSGTATYTLHIKKPSTVAPAYMIDLGDVKQASEIFINGQKLATIFGPTFQATIPVSLLKEDNVLEVKVTNSMVNRIIDLEKRGVQWKKFYGYNFPAIKPENANEDGQLDVSHWEPQPSGLNGPVTLTPVNFITK